MNNIIKALVTALYQHECWNNDIISDDVSTNALAEVATILKGSTAEELALLESSVLELAEISENPDFSNYCKEFTDLFIIEYDEHWGM